MTHFYKFLCVAAIACCSTTLYAEDFGNPAIEGDWEITLNGHYQGSYSLGQFTEPFVASLDGNTVVFESSGSQYNIVAEFIDENTLQFNKCQVVFGQYAYNLWQSPYINSDSVSDIEDLTEQVFTATFNPESNTITFPEHSGLRYGYFNSQGGFSYWDDAFDFVSAKRSTTTVVGTYDMVIQVCDENGITTQDPVEIKIDVQLEDDGSYSIVEQKSTYFHSFPIPFTYSEETGNATFKYTYDAEQSEQTEQSVWMAPFIYRKPNLVPQNNFVVPFNFEKGFTFPLNSGLGWFIGGSSSTFGYTEFYTAYYVLSENEEDNTATIDLTVMENESVEYYNLQGIRVLNPTHGIYITRQGVRTAKIILNNE